MPLNAHVVDDGLRAAQASTMSLAADAGAAKIAAAGVEVEQTRMMMALAKEIADLWRHMKVVEEGLVDLGALVPVPRPEPVPEED